MSAHTPREKEYSRLDPSATKPAKGEPAIISPAWVVGFVGHRTGINEAMLGPLIEQELRALESLAGEQEGTLHFYSSVADGADLLALDCADRVGLRLHVVLPLPEEDFIRTFPDEGDRKRALARLATIRQKKTRDTWRLAPTSMRTPDAYFEADTRIVEAADVMIAVWDGQKARGLGGTAQIVDLADAKGLPLILIHKDTGEIDRRRLPSKLPLDPILSHFMEAGIVQFSRSDEAGSPAQTALLKAKLSDLASLDAAWFRTSSTWFIVLNALATFLGAVGGLLPQDRPWSRSMMITFGLIECALVLLGLKFRIGGKRKRMRAQWIEARFAADLYRGMVASMAILDPLHPLIATERPDPTLKSPSPDWRRFALSIGLQLHAHTPLRDWQAISNGPYAERLEKQRNYFRDKGTPPSWLRLWEKVSSHLVWILPVVLLPAFYNRLWGAGGSIPPGIKIPISTLPVLIPLFIVLPSSILFTLDFDRRSVRYPDMLRKVEQLQAERPHLKTEESFRRFVVRAETLMQAEHTEWYYSTSRVDPG